MQINVEVSDVTLASVVSDGDDYRPTETIADIVAEKLLREFTSAERDVYGELRRRVAEIRDEEIRAALVPALTDALNASVRRTNTYGEPTGPEVTMREVITDEAKKMLTARSDYGRGETFTQKVIKDAVGSALRNELAAVINEEKAKVVAAVRAQAATIIADAVKRGIGG